MMQAFPSLAPMFTNGIPPNAGPLPSGQMGVPAGDGLSRSWNPQGKAGGASEHVQQDNKLVGIIFQNLHQSLLWVQVDYIMISHKINVLCNLPYQIISLYW